MFSVKEYLKALFYPDPPTGHFLDLKDHEVRHLLSLRKNEDFGIYLNAVDRLIKLRIEAMLASQSEFTQTRLIGEVNGLRSAARLIDELNAKEQHADAERTRQHSYKRQPSDAARRLATLSSPAWSDYGPK